MKKKKIQIWPIITYILYGVVILFALFALSSKLPIPGNFKLLTVMSGSMEPTVKIGSLVIVKPANDYQVNDIITFRNLEKPQNTTTHRIVKIIDREGTFYMTTQGDANGTPDSVEVRQDTIIGKVRLTIPYLGYPIAFSKTVPGLIIFVIIPAIIIIYDEILNIKREIKKRRFKRVEVK